MLIAADIYLNWDYWQYSLGLVNFIPSICALHSVCLWAFRYLTLKLQTSFCNFSLPERMQLLSLWFKFKIFNCAGAQTKARYPLFESDSSSGCLSLAAGFQFLWQTIWASGEGYWGHGPKHPQGGASFWKEAEGTDNTIVLCWVSVRVDVLILNWVFSVTWIAVQLICICLSCLFEPSLGKVTTCPSALEQDP